MIVCSCNVLSDHDVRTVLIADRTPTTIGQVYGCLDCNAQCGRCARTIRRIMEEVNRGRDFTGKETLLGSGNRIARYADGRTTSN